MGKNNLLNKTKFSEVSYLTVEQIVESSESQTGIQPLAFISPSYTVSGVKYVTEGDNVTFECAATGVPFPQLNWSFKASTGKEKIFFLIQILPLSNVNYCCLGNKHNTILNYDETSVNILSLINVSTKDSGTYKCQATQSVTGWPDFPHAQVIK